jgi:hypothetical protein
MHLNPTYELRFFVGWVEHSETQQGICKVFFVGWVEHSETQQGICEVFLSKNSFSDLPSR